MLLAVIEVLAISFPSYALLRRLVDPYVFPSSLSVSVRDTTIILEGRPVELFSVFSKTSRSNRTI
ncbi:MAG: hypothetical protein P4M11_06920 [Candidatus Pacebacteria bacterium]|nr:hypothetical protein [Candidatus Paceibacterota bacterium]